MTGFRVALGGAQSLFDVMPDMTTLGKVIGGGLPVGAFGGRERNNATASATRSSLSSRHIVRKPGCSFCRYENFRVNSATQFF